MGVVVEGRAQVIEVQRLELEHGILLPEPAALRPEVGSRTRCQAGVHGSRSSRSQVRTSRRVSGPRGCHGSSMPSRA